MAMTGLRTGVLGCDPAAADHVGRLLAVDGVSIVGCAVPDPLRVRQFASRRHAADIPALVLDDHSDLLRRAAPEAMVISSPDRSHYRVAMDGLQAGCHFLLSTGVQEAVDIVGLARARDLKVSIGPGFRSSPPLIRSRELIASVAIGRLSLVASALASIRPGDLLAEVGIDWIDALLWTLGGSAELVGAIPSRDEGESKLVTTASIRLADGLLASVRSVGDAPQPSFEWAFHGELGRIRADESSMEIDGDGDEAGPTFWLETDPDLISDLLAAIREGAPLVLPGLRIASGCAGPGGDRSIARARAIRRGRVNRDRSWCREPGDARRSGHRAA